MKTATKVAIGVGCAVVLFGIGVGIAALCDCDSGGGGSVDFDSGGSSWSGLSLLETIAWNNMGSWDDYYGNSMVEGI